MSSSRNAFSFAVDIHCTTITRTWQLLRSEGSGYAFYLSRWMFFGDTAERGSWIGNPAAGLENPSRAGSSVSPSNAEEETAAPDAATPPGLGGVVRGSRGLSPSATPAGAHVSSATSVSRFREHDELFIWGHLRLDGRLPTYFLFFFSESLLPIYSIGQIHYHYRR